MIESADEFVRMRTSSEPEEYLRAATDSVSLDVWKDVLARFPEMKIWVAHNKTIPMEILEVLARDPDPNVRSMVAVKNKLTPELFTLLANDEDIGVRQRIAHNKNVPAEIHAKLSVPGE